MDKPDALRLADELDEPEYLMHKQAAEAAAELRRLHAQRDALLEAMVAAHDQLIGLQPIIANGLLTKQQLAFIDPHIDVAMETLVAAIKAIEENT